MSNQTPGLANPEEIAYARDLAELRVTVKLQHGHLTEAQLPTLVRLRRLDLVLVRCGMGRFLCPAQDAAPFIELVERDGSEHVRDVSWKDTGGSL